MIKKLQSELQTRLVMVTVFTQVMFSQLPGILVPFVKEALFNALMARFAMIPAIFLSKDLFVGKEYGNVAM